MSDTGKGASVTNYGDAAIAVERFLELLPNPVEQDDDAEAPLSLIAAAALWAGCLEDVATLRDVRK